MEDTKKQNYPKTIRAIVDDLRAKGELDEEKWREYQKKGKSFDRFWIKIGLCISIFSILEANFLPPKILSMTSWFIIYFSLYIITYIQLQQIRVKNLYLFNYGTVQEAKIISSKYLGRRHNLHRISYLNGDTINKETFSNTGIDKSKYQEGAEIEILVDPIKTNESIVLFDRLNDFKRINIQKD